MSEENVEVVRLAYQRVNAGDIDGFLQLCTAAFEFRDVPELPGSGVFVGHDAVRGWYAQLVEAFEDLQFEVDQVTDLGGDSILLLNRATGRGRGSGATVELTFFSVATLRDGKLVNLVSCGDRDEALEAAGLRE
jgi:ketosteroid isomerase-like protein